MGPNSCYGSESLSIRWEGVGLLFLHGAGGAGGLVSGRRLCVWVWRSSAAGRCSKSGRRRRGGCRSRVADMSWAASSAGTKTTLDSCRWRPQILIVDSRCWRRFTACAAASSGFFSCFNPLSQFFDGFL